MEWIYDVYPPPPIFIATCRMEQETADKGGVLMKLEAMIFRSHQLLAVVKSMMLILPLVNLSCVF